MNLHFAPRPCAKGRQDFIGSQPRSESQGHKLVLLIEGTGRNPDSGHVMSVYDFRAYNDSSYLETELKVPARKQK